MRAISNILKIWRGFFFMNIGTKPEAGSAIFLVATYPLLCDAGQGIIDFVRRWSPMGCYDF